MTDHDMQLPIIVGFFISRWMVPLRMNANFKFFFVCNFNACAKLQLKCQAKDLSAKSGESLFKFDKRLFSSNVAEKSSQSSQKVY